jgi:hypothetical protein
MNTNGDRKNEPIRPGTLGQMRRLSTPRNEGVIAVLFAAMFLIGMTFGGVLSQPKSEPVQIASTD